MDDEERKARQREYSSRYYRNHRDERLAYQRGYGAKHAGEMTEYKRKYRVDCADKIAAYRREYNAANADEIAAYRWERKLRHRERLDALRVMQGCAVCGRKDGRLEFHHRDPATKRFNVSEMAGCSPEAIEAELAKCAVLCRKHHAQAHADMKAGRVPTYEREMAEVF